MPAVEHSFISICDIDAKSVEKGIAEAGEGSIRDPLNNVFSTLEEKPKITWDEYLLLNLNTKDKRLKFVTN